MTADCGARKPRGGRDTSGLRLTRRGILPPLLCLLAQPGAAGPPATAAPAALPALERVTVLAAPRVIADFELTDQDGRPRRFSSLRGAPALIFFGFTNCPDVCPTTMGRLKLLHETSGGALKAARIIMISVDGERDTPAVMKKYLASLSPDFLGLTGNPRTVGNIAARFSAVAFKEQLDQAGKYNFFHSSQVFLVDKGGRWRASFVDASVENMATITRLVLSEKDPGAGS